MMMMMMEMMMFFLSNFAGAELGCVVSENQIPITPNPLWEKKTKIKNVLYAGNPLFCSLLQEDEKSKSFAKTQITEIFSGAILDPLKQEIIFFKLSVKFMSDIKLDIWFADQE